MQFIADNELKIIGKSRVARYPHAKLCISGYNNFCWITFFFRRERRVFYVVLIKIIWSVQPLVFGKPFKTIARIYEV